MKAIVYEKYGLPDVLELRDVENPTPLDDEVLVEVHAASVNAYDWHFLTANVFLIRLMSGGLLRPKKKILGADIAGRIVAIGKNITRFQVGDDVFGAAKGGSGYLSILPVDQGIEHSAGSAFAPNPIYFDPAKIVQLAIEGGCNAVASTLGILGAVSRQYAHRIPFIVKLNHNELLTYPNQYDQIPFASVNQAFDLGAVAVGATIYFGSPESDRQIQEVSQAFQLGHQLGLVTILWAYLRNPNFKVDGTNYEAAADLTGQANYLSATIEADIVKQKQPTNNGGYKAVDFGRTHEKVYTELSTEHPIDLTRYQVINCFMGRAGLINSGGASSGKSDLADVVRTAVINKCAGGMGLISGRKAFQRPMSDGIRLLNAVQDVYLDSNVTVA